MSETADATAPYGSVQYADPGYQSDGVKRYPINTAEHTRAAWSYINQGKNSSKYSASQVASIKNKIKAAAKKFGVAISDDQGANLAGVERRDYVPNPSPTLNHHDYKAGTYEWAGEVMCSTCGLPDGAAVHAGKTSTPTDTAADATPEQEPPGLDDITDMNALHHAQAALIELVKALNNEPDSFNIANAILYLQDAVDCLRSEVLYNYDDPDRYETPAITDAAQLTLDSAAANMKKTKKGAAGKKMGSGGYSSY